MPKPSITVIIPTYNAHHTLERAISSVLSQTYRSFELVLIDGGSVDGTLKYIEELTERESQIRWMSEPDQGIYDAMNKGISLARGEWLYFMGADDVLFSNDVLIKLSVHLEEDSDVIYGKVMLADTGKIIGREHSYLSCLKEHINHQSILYNHKVFKKFGQFSLNYPVFADRVFDLQWFCNTIVKKKFVDVIICKYSNTGMSTFTKDEAFERDKVQILMQYFGPHLKKEVIINQGYLEQEEYYYQLIRTGKLIKATYGLFKLYRLTLCREYFRNALYWFKIYLKERYAF